MGEALALPPLEVRVREAQLERRARVPREVPRMPEDLSRKQVQPQVATYKLLQIILLAR